ncbi:hypothetical protein [Burkholderia multivorans]|uniref:hypothetical protein n=1 Tax=Burkholderia multivorans TaxID=87883 RepID=UPI000ABA967E|nr:hypothetical protein [Burkholderia multivorans]
MTTDKSSADALTDERRNGTEAEVAQWQSRLKDRSSPVVDHWVNISPDGAKTLMEKYADVYEVRALYAAPQPARADARGGLTAAARATIVDACQSISRSADALKECHTVDGDWGDDIEAKAQYEAELRLLDRLTNLLATTQQPSGEVTAFTTTVGRLLATAPHFEECETPEPCLSALIHRYYENYFDREKGREYAELYIAALYEAARAQGGDHE